MFTPDPKQFYTMPAQFGPRPYHPKSNSLYRDVHFLEISYFTEKKQLSALIPDHFQLRGDARLDVMYARNRDIDWLAGRGYNLIAVGVPVRFEGEQDQVDGHFMLVVWENMVDPILMGREYQGVAKIYADIPDHHEFDGRYFVSASHLDSPVVHMEAWDFSELDASTLDAWKHQLALKDQTLGLRFAPTAYGPGAAINEPTFFPTKTVYQRIATGSGEVRWPTLRWEQNPNQAHIINTLAALPNLGNHYVIQADCSCDLAPADLHTRPLR